MKRITSLLCLVLVFSLALSPLGYAEENVDTLVNWRIQISVPDDTTAVLKGQEYYIYAMKTGSIPYVMLTTYHYSSEEAFIEDFTAYMQGKYADLKVTQEPVSKVIGDKTCTEIDYSYSVSGNLVKDRRIVTSMDDLIYLFCSKEVEARGMTVGTMLEGVIADCRFLDEDGNPIVEEAKDPPAEDASEFELRNAYLYTLENGMPKYWLDLTGMMSHNPVLHCYFRGSDPTFYEVRYILDRETADIEDDLIVFHDIYDAKGRDVSEFFEDLRFAPSGQDLVMTVVRDEKTLAGGSESILFSGDYRMSPVGVRAEFRYYQDDGMLKYWLDTDGEDMLLHAMFRSGSPEFEETVFILDQNTAEAAGDYVAKINNIYTADGQDVSNWFKSFVLSYAEGAVILNIKRDEKTLAGGPDDNILTGVYMLEPYTKLRPSDLGPFSPEELARWAQIYYFTESGFYPPKADITENKDGSYTIHLYEVVELFGEQHSATSAWYTVDAYGVGRNDITEEHVRICG